MTTAAEILGLYTGKPEQRWDGKAPSAIRKNRVGGSVFVTETGISDDQQADLEVHGGPEKALHHYPSEHYADWAELFGTDGFAYEPGTFGENISSHGFTEADLCIGDVFAVGSVRLQIAQGRQPCWKLNLHTSNPALAANFQKTGKTGWYYRVLQTGHIQEGAAMTLVERPCPDWNLRNVIMARFNPRLDSATALALANLPELAAPWRASFAKKADPDYLEDTSRRLPGG
ncbi:MOSC domain-containing protein [Labrenzia sp. PHM005]|uniref:MOSC domain-containing protein n=1 Tax=Labrenzia sp. PHM005 TaxID=2590016 RepID=UPI0011407437|nr:MOSC domain-containing protein [Labrenzia sp. PHM005]QDG76470.1 MOSC domain-containing protein [Labrenzia sp. PHM005]